MPGYYAYPLIQAPPDEYQSSNILDFVRDYNPGYVLYDGLAPKFGATTGDDSVYPTYPVNNTGHISPSFLNDWYYRIHFIPAVLNVGNLLSNQSRDVVLWNAFFEPKPVSSFALVNGDGITVTEPVETPYVAEELALYTYVVTLSTIGPPTIDASLVWTIDGEEYEVPIEGRRVVVWPFGPEMKNPIDETLEWLTHVQDSYKNVEQRFAGREQPRRILEYKTQIVGSDTGLFESIVFGWSDRLYAVPLWQERSNLTDFVPLGTVTLDLDTTNRTFVPDGLLVLMKSAKMFEALEIESVTSTSITLKKPVERDWPQGSRVYPVMVSSLEKPLSAQYVAENKIESIVRFTGSPAETNTRTPINAPPVTYNGVEVYLTGTNWGSPITVSYEASYNVLDNGSGVFSLRQRAGWPNIIKSHEWLNKNKTVSTEVRDFFARRRGRLVPAWIPTGTADFTLVEDAALAASVIRVLDNDYGSLVSQHPARQNIIIQVRGGSTIIRRITGYTPDVDGTALLSLDSSIGQNITVKGVRRISFIGLYRMASDSVTFSWRTSEVSVVQASFQLTRPRPV